MLRIRLPGRTLSSTSAPSTAPTFSKRFLPVWATSTPILPDWAEPSLTARFHDKLVARVSLSINRLAPLVRGFLRPAFTHLRRRPAMVSTAMTIVALVSGRLPSTCQPLDWRNAAFNEKFGDGCYVSVGQVYVKDGCCTRCCSMSIRASRTLRRAVCRSRSRRGCRRS